MGWVCCWLPYLLQEVFLLAKLFKAGLDNPGLVRILNSEINAKKQIQFNSFGLHFADWMLQKEKEPRIKI